MADVAPPTFKLGLRPPRPDAIKLKFGSYFKPTYLPPVPTMFGKPWLVQAWGMLGNDSVGDCVLAGAAHETMLFCADAGAGAPPFDVKSVLSDYSAITGYDPADPNSDQGTDMEKAAAYRRATGVVDADGKRHRIDIYADLRAGDLKQIALASYLNGACGIGVTVVQAAMDQFNRGDIWDVGGDDTQLGGHYIPLVGRNSRGNFLFVTWGRLQAATPAWVAAYMDQGVAYLSRENLNAKGLSAQGYAEAELIDDFKQVTA